MAHFGDRHRQLRKIMHSALNARSVQAFQPLQESETYKYLRRLLEVPEDFGDELHK
jgi:cytochrome P450